MTRNHVGKIKKNRCRYCKTKENLTIDHKIPLCQGGTNEKGNLQCLCKKCNEMKAGMSHKQIKALFRWFMKINQNRENNGCNPLTTNMIK